jgi:hypothetical protein
VLLVEDRVGVMAITRAIEVFPTPPLRAQTAQTRIGRSYVR